MGLSGDLKVLPLLDTLNVLSRHRKSGRLTLRTNSDEINVYFQSGAVRSVSTNDPSLRIGRVLVDQGYVTEEQIEQALALQSVAPHPDLIGNVLLDVGYVTLDQINAAVAAQMEAAIFRVLIQDGGTFEYFPEPTPPGDPVLSQLDFEPLVLNATYLADRWLAAQKPADVDTLPERLIFPEVLDKLSPEEREAMQELNSVYSGLHQLAWEVGSSARQYKDSVERLLQQTLVRIAMEATEDEQISGRANARNERLELSDDLIDPWILEDLPKPEKELLLLVLNGTTNVQSLARQMNYAPDRFNRSVERLVEERLVIIRSEDDPVRDVDERDEFVDEAFRLPDELTTAGDLDALSKAERQALIALLNGANTLHQMARESGLPTSLFRNGTDQLIERGFLHRTHPGSTSAEHGDAAEGF